MCAPERGGIKSAMISRIAIPIMQVLGKAPFVNFIAVEELERKIVNAGFKVIETSDQTGLLPSRSVVARRS